MFVTKGSQTGMRKYMACRGTRGLFLSSRRSTQAMFSDVRSYGFMHDCKIFRLPEFTTKTDQANFAKKKFSVNSKVFAFSLIFFYK